MLSPSERTIRARLAAHALHGTRDSRDLTAAARQAFDNKFLAQVDAASPSLPEAERQKWAWHLRQAHFQRLALKSAQARSARKQSRRSLTAPAASTVEAANG